MKIGLMADTHDRLEAVEKAIEFFNRERVEHVLHAGDLVSPFVALKFKELKAKLHYVWGNNEGDREFIRVRLGELGIEPLGCFATLELEGRKLALLHGTYQPIVDSLAQSGLYDAIVRGHTHRAEVIEGKTLVVNPGEVCGYLTGKQTLALLDLVELRAEIIEL